MSNLLDWSYWFSRAAAKFAGPQLKLVIGVIVGLVVVGIVFKILMATSKRGPVKKLWRRLGNLFITTGILVGLFLFFTQTATPLLGARWWFLLWALIAVIWTGFIVFYAIWRMPKQLKADEEHKEFSKYLPRKS